MAQPVQALQVSGGQVSGIDVAVLVHAPAIGRAHGHGDHVDGTGGVGAHIQGVGVVADLSQGFRQFGQVVQGLDFLVEASFLGDVQAIVDAGAREGAAAEDAVHTAVHRDVLIHGGRTGGQVGIVFRVIDEVCQIPEGAGPGGIHDDGSAGIGHGHDHGGIVLGHGGADGVAIAFIGHELHLQLNAGQFFDLGQDGVSFFHIVRIIGELGHHDGDYEGFFRGGKARHGQKHHHRQEQGNDFLHLGLPPFYFVIVQRLPAADNPCPRVLPLWGQPAQLF